MKNRSTCVATFLWWLCCSMAMGGETTITTSDFAPTYNNGTEVVVSPNATITLITKCGHGDVTVEYFPSPGVEMQGSPTTTQNGTDGQSETAIFNLESSTTGLVNTIDIHIKHNGDDGNYCPYSLGDHPRFVICVPQFVERIEGQNDDNGDSGDNSINTANDTTPIGVLQNRVINAYSYFKFNNLMGIKGIDDPSQLEFTQEFDIETYETDNHGEPVPLNDPTANSNGFIPDTSAGEWRQIVLGEPSTTNLGWRQVDIHSYAWNDGHGINNDRALVLLGLRVYGYNYLKYTKVHFKDMVRRHADVKRILGRYYWGYAWDNHNAQWDEDTVPSLSKFTEKTGYISAVFGGSLQKRTGEFYSLYGLGEHLSRSHNP